MPNLSRYASLNTWIAASALALTLHLPAQAQERFSITTPGGAENSLFSQANAGNASGCGGQNLSPALSWNSPPPGTRSFAIVMHDPDGQKGLGVDHWVHYGFSANTRKVPKGVENNPKMEGKSGKNGRGTSEYIGPCPPVGDSPHHYVIQLYALDLDPDALPADLSRSELLEKIKGHILANASVIRRYQR